VSEIGSGSDQDRDATGRFTPGTSGNPSGRPPGIKDKRVNQREKLLEPILPCAIDELRKAVADGQRWAVEMTIAYTMPKPKPVDPEELQDFEQRLTELEQITRGRH
jgi:hypothetical protein